MRRAWLADDKRSAVYRRGDIVIRETGPWGETIHALLRHLEEVGFEGAPRVAGSGFESDGRETLTYIEGEVIDPSPWTVEGAAAVGTLVRRLHDATASFRPPDDALWPPWWGRSLGGSERIVSHCDIAPWNIVSRRRIPVALIDWELAGPVDPLVDLAQAEPALDMRRPEKPPLPTLHVPDRRPASDALLPLVAAHAGAWSSTHSDFIGNRHTSDTRGL